MNGRQSEIDFTHALHSRERTVDTERNFHQFSEKFSGQVATVYKLFKNGVRLDAYTAMTIHRVGCLASVIRHLRAASLIVSWEYLKDAEGKTTPRKIYWIEPENIK